MIKKIEKAHDGFWEMQNSLGDKYKVKFGLFTETRDGLGTVVFLILGPWIFKFFIPHRFQI